MYFKELTICFPLKDSQYFSDSTGEFNKINVIDQNLKSQNQNQFLNVWNQEKLVCKKDMLVILHFKILHSNFLHSS